MNIIIAGCGKVGYTISKHLCEEEDINVTVIDTKQDIIDRIEETLDVMSIKGNALSGKTLNEASVKTADLVICVTNSDETNILCCLTAKKLGAKHTAARVRDPEYALELSHFKKDLGLDLIINPEQQAALEISRLLRLPLADGVETFENGRVELISIRIAKGDFLEGKRVKTLFAKNTMQVLIVTVERENSTFIVDGDTVFKENDIVKILGHPSAVSEFLRHIGVSNAKLKSVIIIGGGKITYYIAQMLAKHNVKIKIIEKIEEKCKRLSEALDNCLIVHGDGTDEELLQSENIGKTNAIVCLTDRDEENVVIAMYAKRCGTQKAIIKINHIDMGLVRSLDLGGVVCPKEITAYQIIRYVLGLKNSLAKGSVLTMHKIIASEGDAISALEFNISAPSKCLNMPIMNLKLKKGVLLACITRNESIIIPTGTSVIQDGDSVIVITSCEHIDRFDDILER